MLRADVELPARRGFAFDELRAAVQRAPDGALVALTLDGEGALDLERWSALTRHPIVDRQLLPDGATRLVVRKGLANAEPPTHEKRLWIYANFHCNLACDYCCVRSSPAAAPRLVGAERAGALAAEARAMGYDAAYVTGGEPFLRSDVEDVLRATSDHLPTTVLTNAMLFRGAKLDALARLPRDRLRLQVSLDSATPATHDAHRGAGAWARAMEGIDAARKLGFRVRVAATTTTDAQMREMDAFLAALGVPAEDRVIRPLARRGNATAGIALARRDLQPELTATADGWYWHPVGATDADLRVAPAEATLAEATREVARLLARDLEEGERIARAFPCA